MNLTTNTNTQNLFFKSNKKREFTDVLNEVQSYISSKYSMLVIDGINNVNSGDDNIKQQVKRYIGKYLLDYRISVEGLTQTELVDKLYTEMAEFSFLTKYIFGTGIEEININSWDDIEVQYSNGTNVKIDEHFESPEHAINVVRRMLHVSGMVLDNASPAILGHLSKNIRIAVLKTPLVDEDVGVAASIRIVNAQKLKKEDFLKSGTATDEMMELLSALVRYGVSTTVAGATSSGKTTLTGWLLTTIPYDKRILTIESGSRELDLVVRDENDKILNKVVHTITRESEDDRKSISQDDLLDMALRFHPDYIVVGEMRSSEADSAQEAARTGHTVITTIHSNSCESTWRRMVTLAVAIGNAFLAPVMAVGLMFVPFWYVKTTATNYKKAISSELETALSIITTAYLRNEDIITSIEENVHYLNAPVKAVFENFISRIKLSNPDITAAILDMKTKIDNEVFAEWCDSLILCQTDRSLKSTLTPIVNKLSDMRIVNADLEYMITGPRKEFISMAFLVIGNIPLLYMLNKAWFNSLMNTVVGQIVLAISAVGIFISTAIVIKLTKPIEYKR